VGEAVEVERGELSMPQDATVVVSSDEELACLAQGGCSASFEELARRFQVPLLQFLRRWVSNEDAEDLVQDTLVRAYGNLHRYRPSWRFGTWLFTIARRLSINQQRRRRPRAIGELTESVEDARPSPGHVVAEEESRQRLWSRAAEVLTEPQMTATWLYYVEDMPVGQVAQVLGRSEGATKATLFRARKRLLPVLREVEPDAPNGNGGGAKESNPCQPAVESNDGRANANQ
jgi:RNA polymerase sigma-70 factor (ECF subfamily)